jgi:glutamate--cysteine ligase
MLMRCSDQECRPLREQLDFATWISDGHPLGWPTPEDLEYHLTTLFPPVRPRGWLELRMIDALPDPWWRVAVAVSSALLAEPDLGDRVARAAAPVRGRWRDAARHGLSDPDLRRAACDCFGAAREVLGQRTNGQTLAATDAFIDQYVARGRCPADDLLERGVETEAAWPEAEGVDPWS